MRLCSSVAFVPRCHIDNPLLVSARCTRWWLRTLVMHRGLNTEGSSLSGVRGFIHIVINSLPVTDMHFTVTAMQLKSHTPVTVRESLQVISQTAVVTM